MEQWRRSLLKEQPLSAARLQVIRRYKQDCAVCMELEAKLLMVDMRLARSQSRDDLQTGDDRDGDTGRAPPRDTDTATTASEANGSEQNDSVSDRGTLAMTNVRGSSGVVKPTDPSLQRRQSELEAFGKLKDRLTTWFDSLMKWQADVAHLASLRSAGMPPSRSPRDPSASS